MEKRYYSGYYLEQELSFIEFVEAVKKNKDIKIKYLPELFLIIEMQYDDLGRNRTETGKTHVGYDFQYIGIEYRGNYYSIQNAEFFSGLDVVGYVKISPILEHQATYPQVVIGYDAFLEYINSQPLYKNHIGKTYDQNMYLIELNHMKSRANLRELDIIENLSDIYTSRHDEYGHILRLISKSGDSCEYDLMSDGFIN